MNKLSTQINERSFNKDTFFINIFNYVIVIYKYKHTKDPKENRSAFFFYYEIKKNPKQKLQNKKSEIGLAAGSRKLYNFHFMNETFSSTNKNQFQFFLALLLL